MNQTNLKGSSYSPCQPDRKIPFSFFEIISNIKIKEVRGRIIGYGCIWKEYDLRMFPESFSQCSVSFKIKSVMVMCLKKTQLTEKQYFT